MDTDRGSQPVVIVTSTLDCADILDTFLRHHVALGVDTFLVADFGSTDGTRDVLTSRRWRDRVSVTSWPPVWGDRDVSTEMVTDAARDLGPGWTILCDPDELFVVSPGDTLRGRLDALDAAGANLVSVPRANLTGPRSSVRPDLTLPDVFGALRYRIAAPVRRDGIRAVREQRLDPPWIFTHVADKLLCRRELVTEVRHGNHGARLSVPVVGAEHHGLELLHAPIRGFEEFRQKIVHAEQDLARHPHLPQSYAWHWRRWIRLHRSGRLREEYLAQFVSAPAAARLLAEGVLVREDRLAGWAGAGHGIPASRCATNAP